MPQLLQHSGLSSQGVYIFLPERSLHPPVLPSLPVIDAVEIPLPSMAKALSDLIAAAYHASL